jgi:hypothetical protein
MTASNHIPKDREIDPAVCVHCQPQIIWKMSERSCNQPAQLLSLNLIQNQLTGRAAFAMLPPEKPMLRTTLDHLTTPPTKEGFRDRYN